MSLAARFSGLFAKPAAFWPATANHEVGGVPEQIVGSIHIPMPDPSREDFARDEWQERGQKMARQEDWERLSNAIRKADSERRVTPGGMPIADLLAYGARADVVGAVEHALIDGRPSDDAPLLDGIEELELVLLQNANDYAIALVVALAHMDMAWAWRGNGWDGQVPEMNRDAFQAHMDRAAEILEPFRGQERSSPALLAAFCALVSDTARTADEVADNYEALIDLNPKDIRQMRALGVAMLPRRYGSLERLELEAARTGARLSPEWGAGGYTFVMMDAISADAVACANIDIDYFVNGLRDVLVKQPCQFTVNLLAAYCAVTMGDETGDAAVDANRARIRDCANWIIRDHLTELHPLIWAHAARGFDNAVRVRSLERFTKQGVTEALRAMKSVFSSDLHKGLDVTFTESGPVAQTH